MLHQPDKPTYEVTGTFTVRIPADSDQHARMVVHHMMRGKGIRTDNEAAQVVEEDEKS